MLSSLTNASGHNIDAEVVMASAVLPILSLLNHVGCGWTRIVMKHWACLVAVKDDWTKRDIVTGRRCSQNPVTEYGEW